MSDEEVRRVLGELGEMRTILARLERLIEQVALGMGISPHG